MVALLAGCGFNVASPAPPDLGPPRDLESPGYPSCAGLTTTCGQPPGTCCESPLLTGGAFDRSYDGVGGGGYEDPSFASTVFDFRLDKYEVTVGRFRAFVLAGLGTQASPPPQNAGAHQSLATSGWDSGFDSHLTADTPALKSGLKCDPMYQTWTDSAGANEDQPINCITWYEALAFCAWDQGFLPTEAEWNYAAAGGAEQRAFPWSVPHDSVTVDDSYAVYMGSASATAPVGSKSPLGDGQWGHSDLAGNVAEWTLDWFAKPYRINPCTNCADLAMTIDGRVVRGGTWNFGAPTLRSSFRVNYPPSARFDFIGVRCARAK
jgi:formylglycine-generating enzyme required for sulfatase activity